MRIICIVCFQLVAAGFVCSQVKPEPFPILAWTGLPAREITAERFEELREMGITVALSDFGNAETMQKALDIAEKTGLKLVASCPELKSNPEQTANRFKTYPALAGYFLRDEPLVKDFRELGEWAKKIKESDPFHFCFVNLFAAINPQNAGPIGAKNYAGYLREFIENVPVEFISYDFYPVLTEGVHERWYESLETVAEESRKSGKPFWAFALASSYNNLHPLPTISALRLQQFSNLAYGAQGLEYWSYRMSSSLRDAPLDLNGNRTGTYDRIKSVNSEIHRLAWVFQGSKVISVKHTGTVIPRGTSRLEDLPWAIKVFETEGEGALVSVQQNGENQFFIIVNRDLNKNMTCFIHGYPQLKRVLKDGKIVEAMKYRPKLELEPGDMAIFMFPAKKPEKL